MDGQGTTARPTDRREATVDERRRTLSVQSAAGRSSSSYPPVCLSVSGSAPVTDVARRIELKD